jgi:sugar phosphate isomerase/epimerase
MTPRSRITPRMAAVLEKVKVNAPAAMLQQGLIDRIVEWKVHPEIGLDHRGIDDVAADEYDAWHRKLKSAGLVPSVHGPFLDLSPGAKDPAVLEITRRRYSQALDIAGRLEAVQVVLHPSYDKKRHQFYSEEWRDTCVETFGLAADRAAELGLRVVLENTYEHGPETILPVIEPLDGRVGFCLDLGHANTFGYAPVGQWVEDGRAFLEALHLHDNFGDRDAHLALGRGDVDFKAFFKKLDVEDVHPRVITLEPHTEKDLWPSLEFLADLWDL